MSHKTLGSMLGELQVQGASNIEVCPDWFNGRAAYGGLVGAMMATAMTNALPDPKPIRSLLVNFVGPVPPEEVEVKPVVLRSGKSVTQVMADVVREGQILTHASAAFGLARPGLSAQADAVFNPVSRDSAPALDPDISMMPNFLQNFEMHWTGGAIPMSGSKDRSFGMWVRHREDLSSFPVARIVAIGDVPPPIMLSHYTKMVRASSLSWSLEFLVPPEDVDTDWFYLDFTLDAASGGYCQQSGRIFDENGRLCAISRQCMVYFE